MIPDADSLFLSLSLSLMWRQFRAGAGAG
jgi:hypothetical protein